MKDLERVALEKRITDVSKALANISKGTEKDFRELILIIKRPGWTTPAELAFTMSALEMMGQQAKVLSALKANLMKAAKTVGG